MIYEYLQKLYRFIKKNFDINEFNYVIKNILSKILDEYYINRNDKIYCIDNLYKKFYVGRYNFIKKKYGIVKNCNFIFRFCKYSKKSYIKLLKDDMHVNLDEGQTYKSVADNILTYNNIKNCKRYVNNMYIEKYLLYLDNKEDCKEVDIKEDDCKGKYNNNFEMKMCHFPPCLNWSSTNYCSIHDKDMI